MNDLSVIIITLNEEMNIGRILKDLTRQTCQNFEVIVVDSNSDDATVPIAKSFQEQLKSLKIIEMKQRGVSLGRNTGAQKASCERLLFLDADTRLNPDFIAQSLWELEIKGLDVAGVYMNAEGGSWKAKAGVNIFNAGIWTSQFFFPTAVGACIFSTRKAHQLIGGFNPEILLCEDCAYVLEAYKQKRIRYGTLHQSFVFDLRRLKQDGWFKTGLTYLRANVRRFFCGETKGDRYHYKFGHYNGAEMQQAEPYHV